jgi:RND superfamily putative drug exporter
MHRLGAVVARRARWVLGVWLVAVVLAFATAVGGVTGESLFDRLSSGDPSVPGESSTGQGLLSAGAKTGAQVLVQVAGAGVGDAAVADAARTLQQRVSATPDVASVQSPFLVPGGPGSPAAAPLVRSATASTGPGFLVTATLDAGLDKAAQLAAIDRIQREASSALATVPGATARTSGVPLLVNDINHQVEMDLRVGEGIALPVSLLVMVFVFGGFVAAGMPILGAIAAIGGGLASLLVFSHVIDLDATVVNIVTVLGLGLCIDYGLLVVSRFREELHRAAPGVGPQSLTSAQVRRATTRTVATAGRTVLFSGLTVGISLAGLMVFTAPLMKAIGAAGVSVVLVALLVALTLVPALCTVSARRLMGRGSEAPSDDGVFSRLARRVQRRPLAVVLTVVALLLAAAIPALGLRTTSSGTELLPVGNTQRVFFEDLARDFPAATSPAVTVVGRASLEQMADWARTARSLPGVTSVDPPRRVSADVVAVGLRTATGPTGDEARAVVEEVRADRPPFPSWVTGQAAALADFNSSVLQRAPIAIGLVALATLVLLFLMTGSLVLPLKALLLNVVSLGASLGVLVWVFQHGHLEWLIGFSSVGAIESTIPLLLFAFGFGLSMDYEVFLLSRIVELHEQGCSDGESVVLGLQRSGRIITSAAILIVIVFGGFVAGKLLVIKETGVALAFAVAVDATLVRMLLVPATMTLLGRWNWWAPAPLRRWHERHGITEVGLPADV